MMQITNESNHSEMSLLIVDDSPDNLRIIGEILQPHFRVLAATSGEKALAIARTRPHPDLILLDIMMPGMDGYEVLRQLRTQSETASIPVIYVTAMNESGDETRGLELGAVDYIAKPIIPELLLARVRTQLELKSARDWLLDRNTVLAEEVARQVVELKAAKEEAEAASRAKSVFINAMSHELRTPMNGVIGMLQLISAEAEHNDSIADYARIALASANETTRLLAAILEYSSIAHGHVNIVQNPVDLPELLHAIATNWRSRAQGKNLTITCSGDFHQEIIIQTDERWLRRVLDILLDNAIAFTSSGHIEIGLRAMTAEVLIHVRDTGIGMKESVIQRLFTPFEQGDTSSTRKHQGIGLSLAIAHRLIQVMGGELSADSKLDMGSCLTVKLPRSIGKPEHG